MNSQQKKTISNLKSGIRKLEREAMDYWMLGDRNESHKLYSKIEIKQKKLEEISGKIIKLSVY